MSNCRTCKKNKHTALGPQKVETTHTYINQRASCGVCVCVCVSRNVLENDQHF